MSKDGGDAFPMPDGMTLRDYFAATAMNARMQLGGFEETIAAEAYQMADAMLAERAK